MLVVQRVFDALQETGDHGHSLLVVWRAYEDAAMESPKQSNVDVICGQQSKPDRRGGMANVMLRLRYKKNFA